MNFCYFQGPDTEMAGFSGVRDCSLCSTPGPTFLLHRAIGDRCGHGCLTCLRAGRFEFWHDTDIGMLDEDGLQHLYINHHPPPPDFPNEALVELRRTPQIATWQQERWLTHCTDFMTYIGTWDPCDFYAHAPDGDGRALFLRMTDHFPHLWDATALPGHRLEHWHATYYAFRCRHCGLLKGNWDCD